MAKTMKAGRRGHGRHGLDRQHHGARADQGGAHRRRARARRDRIAARGFRAADDARRTEIPAASRARCWIPRPRPSPCATHPSETALPHAALGRFPLGDGLGGAGTHWNGITWRFCRAEFVLRSHLTQRYGKNAIPADLTIQDWGVTYDDLEPYYDRFEKLVRHLGQGRQSARPDRSTGGNPFEGPRASANIPTSR